MPVKIDMDMPKNCSECKLCINESPQKYCAITDSWPSLDNTRPSWCPLQEVKERDMKFAWLLEGADKRYCLFLIKEDGVKIKIKDPKYPEI